MRLYQWIVFVPLALSTSGCAFFMGATRGLTKEEAALLQTLHDRTRGNKPKIESALNDLVEISASALEDTASLGVSISKAKLLESMKSPWTRPSNSMVETQRAVALYHLYALGEAEQAVVTQPQCREAEVGEHGRDLHEVEVLLLPGIEVAV